jgi:hypothetical protein
MDGSGVAEAFDPGDFSTRSGATVTGMRIDRLALVAAPLALFACSSNSGAGGGDLTPLGDAGADASDGAPDDTGGFDFDSAGVDVSTPPADAGPPLVVYAHTDTTLYQMGHEPPYDVTKLGDFDCVPSQTSTMTDVAVDSALNLWSISARAVWQLQVSGGVTHCAKKIPLNTATGVIFYALTFAPSGVLDPTKEVLAAGNTAGELWSIDDAGNVVLRGNFGVVPANDGNGNVYPAANVGKTWELSGDVVFLANGGKPIGFATVRDCPSPPSTAGCSPIDTLIELDLAKLSAATPGNVTKAVRGKIVRAASCGGGGVGFGSMYGIAAWNDKVFGFSKSGDLVTIDNNDGTACLVKTFATERWDGAGVTTNAPVIAPPVR